MTSKPGKFPVWGSVRRASYEFDQGNYGAGILNFGVGVAEALTLGLGAEVSTASRGVTGIGTELIAAKPVVKSSVGVVEEEAAKGSTQLTTRFVSTADGIVDVSPTLNRISSGVKFPHRNDGSIFKNLEGLLPNKPAGYYNEFVHPIPGMKGPGPMRIVTGQGGEMWFTPNHYKTFIPIR
jgi:guanyl-specific ribonuclease Sa